ncbi:hypothetical protein BOX37_01480 [Nocardia mangyaensis]|uniref:Uncharacterized protein n=1 Tax=Nocardia mangyaensis TaxID=2213200 RepID=A0A1J0VLE2_9NOCA|nr:hypothetical protein [Nocardia mangyaensis]APE32859.1 hypothetical protein BOX37_01480 [Nocardia mangyaensis]
MTRHILGARDMTGLTILAQMYGAPMDLVASMHSVSMRSAYRMAQRWRDTGMVSGLNVRPVPGPAWVFPTRTTAESLLGFEVRHWAPSPKQAAHVAAVFAVRTALTGLDLDRWTSERVLHSEVGATEAGKRRPHIHHGRYSTRSGELWAVQVELIRKAPSVTKSAMYRAFQAAQAAGCDGLVFYCRGEPVKRAVREAAAGLDLTGGPRMRLADLDELLARPVSPAEQRPDLTVIPGGAATAEHGKAASL